MLEGRASKALTAFVARPAWLCAMSCRLKANLAYVVCWAGTVYEGMVRLSFPAATSLAAGTA